LFGKQRSVKAENIYNSRRHFTAFWKQEGCGAASSASKAVKESMAAIQCFERIL